MKKFIINILLFSLCFLIIFYLLEQYFKYITPSKDRYAWQYEELFNPKINADIAIFGTSKSVRGINPKQLEYDNISVYNFGLNGSNPEFMYHWYNNFFKKHYPKPKLILFEVSWLMFNENWMWRKIEQDSRYIPFEDFFWEVFNADDKATLFLNRFHIFNNSVGDGGIIDSTYNGYTPFPNEKKVIEPYLDSISFDPSRQRKFFNLLINSFNKENVQVLYVMLPEKINKDIKGYEIIKNNLEYIDNTLNKYDFINFHNKFIEDSLFKDWGHLNINGAQQITDKLQKEIKSRLLNSHYN